MMEILWTIAKAWFWGFVYFEVAVVVLTILVMIGNHTAKRRISPEDTFAAGTRLSFLWPFTLLLIVYNAFTRPLSQPQPKNETDINNQPTFAFQDTTAEQE